MTTVRHYADSDAANWDELVERLPEATFCHRSGWMRVVELTWGHRNRSLVAERDGKVTGLLPLFHLRSRLFGSRLLSTPNAVYGGPLAEDAATRLALIEAALDLATGLKVDFVELRDRLTIDAPAAEALGQNIYVTFETPLAPDADELMARLPRDVRRMIRLGARAGLSLERGSEELLDRFYEVYAASVHRLGTPVFSRRLFTEFLREFPKECDILVVRHGRRLAGAVMSFYFRDTVMPYFAGVDRDFYRFGASNFMYWSLMSDAAGRGYRRFDFGRSKRGTGAFEFKRGWGIEPRPLAYRFFPIGGRRVPDLTPLNPRFGLLIELWKRLPAAAARAAGPVIVRNLL
ncbi:MAG: FemAB family PEP-CTERM system-associated protein [Acidobacteriota bacterium]|nr:MAG: FemAB family PEP-CTERM system-associated protein [Acidobacteriota bacterium]